MRLEHPLNQRPLEVAEGARPLVLALIPGLLAPTEYRAAMARCGGRRMRVCWAGFWPMSSHGAFCYTSNLESRLGWLAGTPTAVVCLAVHTSGREMRWQCRQVLMSTAGYPTAKHQCRLSGISPLGAADQSRTPPEHHQSALRATHMHGIFNKKIGSKFATLKTHHTNVNNHSS